MKSLDLASRGDNALGLLMSSIPMSLSTSRSSLAEMDFAWDPSRVLSRQNDGFHCEIFDAEPVRLVKLERYLLKNGFKAGADAHVMAI